MSKKEKKKKNVFGLVSKLGNLIKIGGSNSTTNENMDTSSGENEPKKNFNIQISEENQENIELGDEEEEEEEEEEEQEKVQEEKKESNDTKRDNEIINKKEDIKENNIRNNINNINNIDNEIITNNINNQEKIIENKEEVKKTEIKEENIIIINNNHEEKDSPLKLEEKKEINNNILNNNNEITNIKEKEEIKNQENNNEINNEIKEVSNDNEEKIIEDINDACHLYLKIGNDFNSKDIYCIPLSKIKKTKKKSILQKMNVFKKVRDERINYKIFIEENFIYLAKDIIVDKKNDVLRRIKKIYNIRNILNYTNEKITEGNKYKISFQINNKKNIIKFKEYFIEEQYFEEFNDIMIKKLKVFGNNFKKDEIK